MGSNLEILDTLRKEHERLAKLAAAKQGKYDELVKQRDQVLVKFKKFGVADAGDVEEKLASMKNEATALLQEIENGIPEEYRE